MKHPSHHLSHIHMQAPFFPSGIVVKHHCSYNFVTSGEVLIPQPSLRWITINWTKLLYMNNWTTLCGLSPKEVWTWSHPTKTPKKVENLPLTVCPWDPSSWPDNVWSLAGFFMALLTLYISSNTRWQHNLMNMKLFSPLHFVSFHSYYWPYSGLQKWVYLYWSGTF